MMTAVKPLAVCEGCGQSLWADDAVKTVPIPGSTGHTAILFKCPQCEHATRIAMPVEQWEEAQQHAEVRTAAQRAAIAGARIDISSIQSVEELELEWRSYPPPMREGVHGCNCDDCKRRKFSS